MKMTTLCYPERDGRYLMLHRTKKEHDENHDKWIGVGGKFEHGESPEECMQREVLEETSVKIHINERFRQPVYYKPRPGVKKEVVYFLAFTRHTEIHPRPGEVEEVAWIPLENAMGLLTHGNDKHVLELAMKYVEDKYKQ